MRQDVVHLLAGYEPETERVEYRRQIPKPLTEAIVAMVKPDSEDPDAIDSYAMDYALANDIMGLAHLPFGDRKFDYFLESRAHEAV